MSISTTCTRCNQVLRVPADAAGLWITCPRCLASVGNPNVLETSSATAVTDHPGPVPPVEEVLACSGCGRPIDRRWRVCPHCAEPLTVRPTARRNEWIDGEVRGDTNRGGVLAKALGGLLLLGVVIFLLAGGPGLLRASPDAGLSLTIGICVLAATVAGVVALLSGRKNPAAGAVSGLLSGIAVGAGAVLLAVLVFCLTVIASINQFFETCSKGCK
jgi:hypothetical protein